MTKLNGWDAETAARVIEELFADLHELRELPVQGANGLSLPVELGIGARTDEASARVTLLNVLSTATEGDLMGEDDPLTTRDAMSLYLSLHINEALGYDRGDCHCDHCAYGIDELVHYFGIVKPPSGVYNPAALVREKAKGFGWDG